MTQSTGSLSTSAVPAIEYAVYTFDLPVDGKPHSRWNRHAITDDLSHAMAEAKSLLGTRRFMKVEVKKKFIDVKTRQPVDMTLKTLTLSPAGDMQTKGTIAVLAIFAFILAMAVRGSF